MDPCGFTYKRKSIKPDDAARGYVFRDSRVHSDDELNIFDAVKLNRIECVVQLVTEGQSVNKRDKRGNTPLVFFAPKGFFKFTQFLIERGGADINISGFRDWTPLMLAAYHGQDEIISTLLKHHTKLNVENIEGLTSLRAAIRSQKSQAIKGLLAVGADPNSVSTRGLPTKVTPLMEAAAVGNSEIMQLLLDKGANPTLKDKNYSQYCRTHGLNDKYFSRWKISHGNVKAFGNENLIKNILSISINYKG